MTERYMTQERKRRELEQLASNENLDDGIQPYLDEINSLHSVCTLQSCAGHFRDDGFRDDGHLWLWLSEDIAEAFERQAFDLVRHELITYVGKRYFPDGQEVVDICFRGAAENRMGHSLRYIASWFRQLASQEG